MVKGIKSVSDKISNEITAHTVDLTRVDAQIRKEVRGVLKKMELEIVSELENFTPETRSQVYRMGRLDKLNKQTTDIINGFIKADIMTVGLGAEVYKKISRETLIEGAPSAEWWSRQAGNLQKSFEDQMRQGILMSESNSKLIQRVRGTSTGKINKYEIDGKTRTYTEFSGGILDTGTRQAEALVRTSVQNVANAARYETYKNNNDVIKAVQALVTLDGATTPICQARSGAIWDLQTGEPTDDSPVSESFPGPPPWHWNCRTTLVPVMKSWKELGGKVRKEIPISTQASMDGQVSGKLTYNGWLKTQSKEKQLDILGPSKFEMWEKGDLKLSNLIDNTGRPLSVAKLKEKYG